MKIKKLIDYPGRWLREQDTLIFIKPFGSKIFRLCNIPQKYYTPEIVNLLYAHGFLSRSGIFVFTKTTNILLNDLGFKLGEMDINHRFIMADESDLN